MNNTLCNKRDRVSGRLDILTDRLALYDSMQKDLQQNTTPPVVHPTGLRMETMPEIQTSSQQCTTKHTPKQRIPHQNQTSKPHIVKLSGVRGKNKPDVYARNEKAEPAPQVEMLKLR